MKYREQVATILKQKHGFNDALLQGWYVDSIIAQGERAKVSPKKCARSVKSMLTIIDNN